MLYLNPTEQTIIENFIEVQNKYENKKLELKWRNLGSAFAIYDSLMEDENDCELDNPHYEEYWSFVFKVIHKEGNPPIEITKDNFFTINYHNFPDSILADGKEIS